MDLPKIRTELSYKAVRSSGAGGQNVNKVSSKVVLTFDLKNSNALSDEEKLLLSTQLANRLTTEHILILTCDEDRSQLKNKAIVTQRFFNILAQNLALPKERKATKIPKSAIRKRLKDKKDISEIKKLRKRPEW